MLNFDTKILYAYGWWMFHSINKVLIIIYVFIIKSVIKMFIYVIFSENCVCTFCDLNLM